MKEKLNLNMDELNGWGHSIGWLDYKKRRIHGHFCNPRNIENGDILSCEVKVTGKELLGTRHFEVIEVEYMSDPRDQFFGSVRDVGLLVTNKADRKITVMEGEKCPLCKKTIKKFQKGLSHLENDHAGEFKRFMDGK